MSSLKIGGNSTGLFVGNKQILGGVENLLNEITIAPDFANEGYGGRILIANFSDNENLSLYRDGSTSNLPARHIEWYSVSADDRDFDVSNYGDIPVRCLSAHVESGSDKPMIVFEDVIANNDEHCINWTPYFTVLLIFNAT